MDQKGHERQQYELIDVLKVWQSVEGKASDVKWTADGGKERHRRDHAQLRAAIRVACRVTVCCPGMLAVLEHEIARMQR